MEFQSIRADIVLTVNINLIKRRLIVEGIQENVNLLPTKFIQCLPLISPPLPHSFCNPDLKQTLLLGSI